MKKRKNYVTIDIVLASFCALMIVIGMNNQSFLETNVEVLARSEGGGFGPMCSQTGTQGTYNLKKCSECTNFGKYAMDRVAYCPK